MSVWLAFKLDKGSQCKSKVYTNITVPFYADDVVVFNICFQHVWLHVPNTDYLHIIIVSLSQIFSLATLSVKIRMKGKLCEISK